MPTRIKQLAGRWTLAVRVFRSLAFFGGILGIALGAVFWLTAPEAAHRPRELALATPVRGSAPRQAAPPAAPSVTAPEVGLRLFGEDWIDDSGYEFARLFVLPIKDFDSLKEIRTANEARFDRGFAELKKQLAAVDRRTASGKVR